MSTNSEKKLELFQSLFKARTDVYAIRWEKEGKSGYMPAYDINWEEFNRHKAQGGTLKTFKNKKHLPLSSEKLREHLSGKHTIGVYPLLIDNTSFFIAADFDEQDWLDDSLKLVKTCHSYNIPAYLERSRSGKGGHVWIFFESNYPAWKSRKVLFELLKKALATSPLDEKASFDRLFPNQDYHSGIGLGNLIALPLNKKSLDLNNSCFLDIENLNPYPDQWKFLSEIIKVPTEKMDEVYGIFSAKDTNDSITGYSFKDGPLSIVLDSKIILNKNSIHSKLFSFIKEHLNFTNKEFILKKKLELSTFNTEANFNLIRERGDQILLPRGFVRRLIDFCKEEKIEFHFEDRRIKLPEINFISHISLRNYQAKAFDVLDKKDFGVIIAPPGAGKTVIGLELIARKKQPALIIVHRKQLFDQWIERIQSFLSIPKSEIGQIIGGNKSLGKYITVAMIQSIESLGEINVGTVIIDECHHIPAKTFREAIERINTYYLYGLTATPKRRNNDESLIYAFIGDVLTQVIPEETESKNSLNINIRETNFYLPFDSKIDNKETLFQALINDTSRNQIIVNDIISEAEKGRNILILTERKAHVKMLFQYLNKKFEVVEISGDDSEKERGYKLKQIREGNFQIIISTGQYLGEGSDINDLSCLFLVYPFSFEGKLIQYIGRIQRNNRGGAVYDYRDSRVEYLEKLFIKRQRYYKRKFEVKLPDRYDEYILIFNGRSVFIDHEDNELDIRNLELPEWIESFKEKICWRVRVLKYEELDKRIFCEVLSYDVKGDLYIADNKSPLLEIEKIAFKSVDTSGLMHSIESRKKISDSNVRTNHIDSTFYPRTYNIKNDVSFDDIEFNYGYISFRHHNLQIGKTITFRIYNEEIRPEFDAIRVYFKKVLRVKTITYEAEVETHIPLPDFIKATSNEIKRISSEVIESLKFEFVKSKIFKFKEEGKSPLLDKDELLEVSANDARAKSFFNSDIELFDAILKTQKSKHYFHLKYLSGKHKSSVIKLRFVIKPFSFIFLLEGKTQYHIVWETLDTKEATYIWHSAKTVEALDVKFVVIQDVINQSRIDGKMNYLSSDPKEFSRIYHDYSDPDKGFILWKGMLDEKIT